MARTSALDAARTRARIVHETAQQLSVQGGDGVSLGAVADALGMSKAGVAGPFRSREALVLEAFEHAVQTFRVQVIAPALAPEVAGTARSVRVLIESWVDYLRNSPFRGGCILTSLSSDQLGRPGALHDQVREAAASWQAFLAERLALTGLSAGRRADAAVTLIGLSLALNQAVQLYADAAQADRIERLMRQTAGISAARRRTSARPLR